MHCWKLGLLLLLPLPRSRISFTLPLHCRPQRMICCTNKLCRYNLVFLLTVCIPVWIHFKSTFKLHTKIIKVPPDPFSTFWNVLNHAIIFYTLFFLVYSKPTDIFHYFLAFMFYYVNVHVFCVFFVCIYYLIVFYRFSLHSTL